MSTNHSGIGIVSSDGFELPLDLLLPLSIQEGRELTVLFYPPPADHNPGVVFENDFMITPISHELWPICANLTVRVEHRTGTMHKVAKCLSDNDVSIQLADFSRSGHRYATWNLVVSFDELIDADVDDLQWDSELMIYKTTSLLCHKIENEIINGCSEEIFTDPTPDLEKGVNCDINFALVYFYNELQKRKKNIGGDIPPAYLQPMIFTRKGTRLVPINDQFDKLLDVLYDGHLPDHRFFVFAETNLTDKNIRVLLIPEGEQKRHFVKLELKYFKESQKHTSRGLMAHFLNQLKLREFNVWSSTQNTFNSNRYNEQGIIEALVESPFEVGTAKWKTHEVVKNEFSKALKDGLPENLRRVTIHDVGLEPFRLRDVSSKITGIDFEFDFFFIHKHDDFREVMKPIELELHRQGLKVFYADNAIASGERYQRLIIDSLRSSEAAIFFFSKRCIEDLEKNDSWIWREVHGSIMQDKTILTVLFGTDQKQLQSKFSDFAEFLDLAPFRYVDEKDAPSLAKRAKEILLQIQLDPK